MRDVRGTDGRRGLRGGARKRVDRVPPGRPQSFRYRPVDGCSPGRGGMAQDGGTSLVAKEVAAEKVGARLWHAAVVCPNVTGRAKERIAQSKRARAGSLTII